MEENTKRNFTFTRTTPGMNMVKDGVRGRYEEKTGKYVLNRNQINKLNPIVIFDFRPNDVKVKDEYGWEYKWKLLNSSRLIIEVL
jgi:hypothetical protein